MDGGNGVYVLNEITYFSSYEFLSSMNFFLHTYILLRATFGAHDTGLQPVQKNPDGVGAGQILVYKGLVNALLLLSPWVSPQSDFFTQKVTSTPQFLGFYVQCIPPIAGRAGGQTGSDA